MSDTLNNLSPLDGRYREKTKNTRANFSESALIKARLISEIHWLDYFLTNFKSELKDPITSKKIHDLSETIPDSLILKVKDIEKTTNHDVKAVELALVDEFNHSEEVQSLIHIFLTSEDINSLSYALMLKKSHTDILAWVHDIILALEALASDTKGIAMMARTHGQPASPTTLGKEINVFATRLKKEYNTLLKAKFYAKWGGATANYNPHIVAYPDENWVMHSKEFLKNLDVDLTVVSTQIEPHDYMSEIFHNIIRINNILIDLTRDIWTYISLDYFSLKMNKNEVGSSTMPHKVNPIDFENAEGNIGLSNALLSHLAEKLTISRLQRDLSDSTVLRNIGSAFGYLEIAVQSALKGIEKLEANEKTITNDLIDRYELLTEALQSFLRLEGKKDGYDLVKQLSRGQKLDHATYLEAVDKLIDNEDYKTILRELTPLEYIGMAAKLAEE